MTLEEQIREHMWGITEAEKNIVIHYMKEDPQLFIDFATEIQDTIHPEVERVARAILYAEWEEQGGYFVSSAISRDLWIDKRWRDRIDDAKAKIAEIKE